MIRPKYKEEPNTVYILPFVFLSSQQSPTKAHCKEPKLSHLFQIDFQEKPMAHPSEPNFPFIIYLGRLPGPKPTALYINLFPCLQVSPLNGPETISESPTAKSNIKRGMPLPLLPKLLTLPLVDWASMLSVSRPP